MASVFEKITNDESILKLRIFSICAFVSSFAFYYFMVLINPSHLDWFPGRLTVAVIAFVGFIISFLKSASFTRRRLFVDLISFAYIVMYLYLMQINQWSVFHRWSYFVVISIMATICFTWKDYIYTALIGLGLPVIFGFFCPLNYLELVHFHAANFVTFFVIGLTIKANFEYRNEVIKLTDNLIQNSKMTALGEMSSGVSHEINNPLAIISNSVAQIEICIDQVDINQSAIKSALEKISRATQRIVRIVQGLHSFSQSDNKEHFKLINLNEIIKDASQMYTEKFKATGINLTLELPREKLICYCQPMQVIQILSNLITNAYEACIHAQNPSVTVQLLQNNQNAIISICDTGLGVPVEIEKQIMQPFFTTKPVGQGTGLGLSISLGIARFNGGDLYLDRSVANSCFKLKLPIAQSSSL